jgi:BolA protein
MTQRRDMIHQRLTEAFEPSHLEVIDESDQHVGHAGHQGGGRHFAVVIKSSAFTGMTRIQAHQAIYALFADMIPDKIHALKIKIISD